MKAVIFSPNQIKNPPKVFFENYYFRKINDDIIENNGYEVKKWGKEIPNISCHVSDRKKIRNIISEYDKKYKNWGFKDPRTCLTLGLWLEEIKALKNINTPKIVYITRNHSSVAHSMVKRGDTSYDEALAVCDLYNQRVHQTLSEYGIKPFRLSYEDLVGNIGQAAASLFDYLGLPLNTDSLRFINRSNNSCKFYRNTNWPVTYRKTKKILTKCFTF